MDTLNVGDMVRPNVGRFNQETMDANAWTPDDLFVVTETRLEYGEQVVHLTHLRTGTPRTDSLAFFWSKVDV